ncbi:MULTISPECIES: spore germination protein [Bacillus cereus group]|uniref:spore germination protein n=1 Tax=Bacillus cereus group TaxID=86661 RepID=UPI000BFEA211|nr:spore germination protein [Bacillus cereus]PGL56623.1 hypothetical protein CN927_27740 [Bacillus cereus]
MPAILGNLVVQTSNVSPKENTKSYNGSGSSNNAFITNNFSGVSATNTFDSDVADQDQIVSN